MMHPGVFVLFCSMCASGKDLTIRCSGKVYRDGTKMADKAPGRRQTGV
jgi:hypothetical protein